MCMGEVQVTVTSQNILELTWKKKPQNGMLYFNIIHGPVVKLTENS